MFHMLQGPLRTALAMRMDFLLRVGLPLAGMDQKGRIKW